MQTIRKGEGKRRVSGADEEEVSRGGGGGKGLASLHPGFVRTLGAMSLSHSRQQIHFCSLSLSFLYSSLIYTEDGTSRLSVALPPPPQRRSTSSHPDDRHGLDADFPAFSPLLTAVQGHPIPLKTKKRLLTMVCMARSVF